MTERRRDINRKCDFRFSADTALGMLLCEHLIGEEESRGLREEKIRAIRSSANYCRRPYSNQDFERNRLVTTANVRLLFT